MVIGDRLRELREGKKLSQGDIEKRTGLLRCYISRVENATRFRRLRLWRKWRALSKFHCTNCFMTGQCRPICRAFSKERLAKTLPGVVPAKMPFSCVSSPSASAKRQIWTENCCSPWPKRWKLATSAGCPRSHNRNAGLRRGSGLPPLAGFGRV